MCFRISLYTSSLIWYAIVLFSTRHGVGTILLITGTSIAAEGRLTTPSSTNTRCSFSFSAFTFSKIFFISCGSRSLKRLICHMAPPWLSKFPNSFPFISPICFWTVLVSISREEKRINNSSPITSMGIGLYNVENLKHSGLTLRTSISPVNLYFKQKWYSVYVRIISRP